MHRFFLRTLFLLAFFLPAVLIAQDKERLRRSVELLKTAKEDTNKVKLLNNIAWDTSYENLSVGLVYCNQSLALAEKLGFDNGAMSSWNIAGTIYDDMGEYDKAIDAHHKSLAYSEKNGKLNSQGTSWMNLGSVYKTLGQTQKSYECMLRAIPLYVETNYSKGLSACYNNLGSVYLEMDSVEQAIATFNKGMEYAQQTKSPSFIAHNIGGLAGAFAKKGDSATAFAYIRRVITIHDSLEDNYDKSIAIFEYAEMLLQFQRYDLAEQKLFEAMTELHKIGVTDQEREVWKTLADLYRKKEDPVKALSAMKRYTQLKDSLISEKVLRHQHELEALYENEKKENEIRTLTREKTLQNTYVTVLVSGVLLLVILLFILYNRNTLRKKSNVLLARQNEVIEEKNKNITDSINYARRIQEAMLPSEELSNKTIGGIFTLYHPRDIVSGDFWWVAEHEEQVFVAVADCTGHGVPGGFMSVMGAAFLSEIVSEKGLTEPAEVFETLRQKVKAALKHEGDGNKTMTDGMDIVLCTIDTVKKELRFACANRPLWLVRNGELIESQTDPFPVGAFSGKEPAFTPQKLSLLPGDMIYLFTDGFAAQFESASLSGSSNAGEEKLRKLLISASTLSLPEQKNCIAAAIRHTRGPAQPNDDSCLTGIRI